MSGPRDPKYQSIEPGNPAAAPPGSAGEPPASQPGSPVFGDHWAASQSEQGSRAGWGVDPAPAAPLPAVDAPQTPDETQLSICISCGDEIYGRAPGGLCPECARVLRGVPGVSPVSPDAGVVSTRPCLSCGYDLTGIPVDGRCPECGVEVARSLRGSLLRYSSEAYVSRLHTGILLAEIGTILAVVVAIASVVLDQWLVRAGLSPPAVNFITTSISTVITLTTLAGWWLFSTVDPVLGAGEADEGARIMLRVAIVVESLIVAGAFALKFLLPLNQTALSVMKGVVPLQGVIIAGVSLGAFAIRLITSLLYLRSIARRIPDARLYTSSGRLLWLGPLLTAATCAFGAVFAVVAYILALYRMRALLKATLSTMDSTPRQA